MKAVLQNMKNGELTVQDVPPPALQESGVLVKTTRSLISLGTERAVLSLAKKGPIGKAKDRPDLARKVWNKAKQEGFWSTYQVVKNLLDSPIPLGYSCAGEILEVGSRAGTFHPGQRVACAGLNCANHAEINYVPRNLAIPIPDGVSDCEASFVAVGSIAMQGVRLGQIELGDRVCVIGLGLVGQIAAQLARCSGASVLATDLDPSKRTLAERLGALRTSPPGEELHRAITAFTSGRGADCVLVCAATKNSALINEAARIARLKGRVILVGDVGLELERRPFFEKEVTFVVSRSYGPGRYDGSYEKRGIDYPFEYVRWTEGRNMASFLELVGRGDVQLDPLVTHRYSIEDGEAAYEHVSGKNKEPAIAIVLTYDADDRGGQRIPAPGAATRPASDGKLRLGVIGAGQFAKGVLLPAFAKHAVSFEAFCTSSGLTSQRVAEKYRARFGTGDSNEILRDDAIDAVVIATRHDQHAALASSALEAGKAVFVEKPLAMDEASLVHVCDVIARTGNDRLMVGFNRRFSPLVARLREVFAGRSEPLFATYRVNAGRLPEDSWVFDPVQGGGRITGEVCHFVDVLMHLIGARPERVFAEACGLPDPSGQEKDSVTVSLRFEDGSVGTIHYLGRGDASLPKEHLEVFGGDRIARLDNYRTLTVHHKNKRKAKKLLNQQKGFAEETAAFVQAVRAGSAMPIALGELVAVTQTTFLIQESLATGLPVTYRPPTVEDVSTTS